MIDAAGFLQDIAESQQLRTMRRLTEAEFLRAASEQGTVVLDARSELRFKQLHIQGAVNLPYTEFTADSLKEIIPDKNTKILIYCNNNVADSPVAFKTKAPAASLNLSTFAALYSYGYRNVFELKPLVELGSTKIQFAGSFQE